MSAPFTRLLLLGCGFLGLRVLRLARASGLSCVATTRVEAHAPVLESQGATALVIPELTPEALAPHVDATTAMLVSFPPDGQTDARVASLAARAYASAYISSTGVYGKTRGIIDERTPVAPDSDRTQKRLEAERCWQAAGATILRAAAIYGPGSGMHERLRAGSARIVGDGQGYVSRVHVDDLAQAALGVLVRRVGPRVFVVGDDEPAPQGQVVSWLAQRMGLPVPASVPPEAAPETLRNDRRIDAGALKRLLAMSWRYPSYREGFEATLAEEAASSA